MHPGGEDCFAPSQQPQSRRGHVARVAFVVEQDEPSNPMNVRLLGSVRVVLGSEHVPTMVKKLTRLGGSLDCVGIGRVVGCGHAIHPAAT